MDEVIRVLWLAKGLGPGGMERLLVNHAQFGDRTRFEYSAAYLSERPDSVVPELESLGVKCTNVGGSDDRDFRWGGRLRKLVREHAVDIVHAHSPLPAAISRPIVRVMGSSRPRLVYTEHNTWDSYGKATRIANAATYTLDDAQFAVSIDARESVPSVIRGRVEVLTHGIDVERVAPHASQRETKRQELGVDQDDVVVINVAHLRAEKGQEVLLDAARRVLDECPQALFLSVGHGQLERSLAEKARDLGLGDRFCFMGFRSDVLDLMAASDVFCLSSHQEGLPVAYMESVVLGLPSVVTAVGGLVDHVVDGINGVTVPPDDPGRLGAALVNVVKDADLRHRLAEGALKSAGSFSPLPAIRRQEAVYAQLFDGRSRTKDQR